MSAAFTQGMSVADIIAVADWSSDSMFKKFYYRPVIQKQNISLSHLCRNRHYLFILFLVSDKPWSVNMSHEDARHCMS